MIATAATEQDHMTARGGGRAKGEERERDNTQEKFGWFWDWYILSVSASKHHLKILSINSFSLSWRFSIHHKHTHTRIQYWIKYYFDIFIASGELYESQLYQFSNDKFVESKYLNFEETHENAHTHIWLAESLCLVKLFSFAYQKCNAAIETKQKYTRWIRWTIDTHDKKEAAQK